MEESEKKWFDAALDRVERAKQKGVLVLMIRTQDINDEADIIITNAESPEMVVALWPDRAEASE